MVFTGPFRAAARADAGPYGRAAMAGECAEMARTSSGRNDRLNRAAFRLGQIADEAGLTESEITGALMEAAEASGYVAKRGRVAAARTIRSGYRAGLSDPREVPAPGDYGRAAAEVSQPDPAEVARRAHEREIARRAQQADDRAQAEFIARVWREADPNPQVSLPGRYFREHRGLELLASTCGHALRFHPAGPWERERVPMMLASMRDPLTGKVVALHRTRLCPDTASKLGRKMLGRARGAAIMLTRHEDVGHGLHIAEGIETAIAGMMIGFSPMWALGSSGNIKSFDVLPGVEALTICGETGDASADAVEECGVRWSTAGREVRVSFPRVGSDLNDSLRAA